MKRKFAAFFAPVLAVCVLISACQNGDNQTSAGPESGAGALAENGSFVENGGESDPQSNLEGIYDVEGENPDGTPYGGRLKVMSRSSVYQFSWEVNSMVYEGVGVLDGDVMAVAYSIGTSGKGCGVSNFRITDNKALDGAWGQWSVNSTGKEHAERKAEAESLDGEYQVNGTTIDGKTYQGVLGVTQTGETYNLHWKTYREFVGTGVKYRDRLVTAWGEDWCGFAAYEVKKGVLEGIWASAGSKALGKETATKK
jgi:hypothetical protein